MADVGTDRAGDKARAEMFRARGLTKVYRMGAGGGIAPPGGGFSFGYSLAEAVFFCFLRNKSGCFSLIAAGIPRLLQLKTHCGLFPSFRAMEE